MSVTDEGGLPALPGLAGQVDLGQLGALLAGRPPDTLTKPERWPLLAATLRGLGAEVTAIVGAPGPGTRRDLAVWALTLGAAASLEAALFPEQQVGDSARAEILQRRYLGVLADLRRYVAATPEPGASGGEDQGGYASGLVALGYGTD